MKVTPTTGRVTAVLPQSPRRRAGAPARTVAPSTPAPAPSGRELPHPAPEEIALEAVLHALSDPMRLCVVRKLAGSDDGATCSEVELPVSPSTSTHHFRVLREAGVIAQRYRGTAKLNSLRRADLDGRFPGLLDAVLAASGQPE